MACRSCVIALSTFVQIALGRVHFIASLFKIHPMSAADIGVCRGLGLVRVTVLEVGKLLRRGAPGPAFGRR